MHDNAGRCITPKLLPRQVPKHYIDLDAPLCDGVLVNGVDRLAAHRATIRDANTKRQQREAAHRKDYDLLRLAAGLKARATMQARQPAE